MRLQTSFILALLLLFLLGAVPASADGDPPFDPLHQPSPQSPYGMDLMGPGWQWTFPREQAWPRLDGEIRVDLIDELVRQSWAAGVRSARISTWWCMVEPEKDVYRWRSLDKAIQIARNYGMDVMLQIFYTPDWAALGHDVEGNCIDPGYRNLPPQDMNDWSDFMAELTARYGPTGKDQVHAWEIWNEPDLLEFWYIPEDPWHAGAPMYAKLVQRARAQVDANDPNGKLVVGSLSDIYGPRFLGDLMALEGEDDIRDDIDVLSFHLFAEAALKIYSFKEALGDNHFELWATELNSPLWDEYVPLVRLTELYDLLDREEITRSFWFKSWTSQRWGPGLFTDFSPGWARESFDPGPFYATFQSQALFEQPPQAPHVLSPPQAIIQPQTPQFLWLRPAAGSAPIVGYKLQVDNSLFRGHPYFQSPELDVWVPVGELTFLPLQMAAGGSSAAQTTPVATIPAQPVMRYRPDKNLAPGLYYWRVAAVDAHGNVGTYSSIRTLIIGSGNERIFLPAMR